MKTKSNPMETNKCKLRDIQQNNWSVLFKNVTVRKSKVENIEWQVNRIDDSRLDPELEKMK